MKRCLLIFCTSITLLLAGCNTSDREIVSQSSDPYRIYLTPSLHPLWPALQACAAENPQAFFVFQERFYDQIESPDLVFRLGEAEELPGFSAPLAEEEIVVVINVNNPVSNLSLRQIQNIFHGAIQNWDEVGGEGEIHVWALLDADEPRVLFERHVLNPLRLSPFSQLAPSAGYLKQAIIDDPGAIGYLPRAWVDETLKVIDVGLKAPVLMLAEKEPQGDLRQLVVCLQGETGQAPISGVYIPLDQ